MISSPPEKTWLHKFLSSKIVLAGSLILLLLISIALGKAVYRRHQIQKEIAQIKAEITQAEGQKKELEQLIAYLATDAFKEKMARQKLNLQRSGETVVAIPVPRKEEESLLGITAGDDNLASAPINGQKIPNPRKWWNYFFAHP